MEKKYRKPKTWARDYLKREDYANRHEWRKAAVIGFQDFNEHPEKYEKKPRAIVKKDVKVCPPKSMKFQREEARENDAVKSEMKQIRVAERRNEEVFEEIFGETMLGMTDEFRSSMMGLFIERLKRRIDSNKPDRHSYDKEWFNRLMKCPEMRGEEGLMGKPRDELIERINKFYNQWKKTTERMKDSDLHYKESPWFYHILYFILSLYESVVEDYDLLCFDLSMNSEKIVDKRSLYSAVKNSHNQDEGNEKYKQEIIKLRAELDRYRELDSIIERLKSIL